MEALFEQPVRSPAVERIQIGACNQLKPTVPEHADMAGIVHNKVTVPVLDQIIECRRKAVFNFLGEKRIKGNNQFAFGERERRRVRLRRRISRVHRFCAGQRLYRLPIQFQYRPDWTIG